MGIGMAVIAVLILVMGMFEDVLPAFFVYIAVQDYFGGCCGDYHRGKYDMQKVMNEKYSLLRDKKNVKTL